MYLYHFQASGFRHGADEFCVDAVAAERIAFDIFLEMSACAKRVVVVTVTNSDGTQILKMPRLSKSDIAELSGSSD
jgi:hypothetical protein